MREQEPSCEFISRYKDPVLLLPPPAAGDGQQQSRSQLLPAPLAVLRPAPFEIPADVVEREKPTYYW